MIVTLAFEQATLVHFGSGWLEDFSWNSEYFFILHVLNVQQYIL